jgi:hypothetical protein
MKETKMNAFDDETNITAGRVLADAELVLIAGGQFYDPIEFVLDPLGPHAILPIHHTPAVIVPPEPADPAFSIHPISGPVHALFPPGTTVSSDNT